MKPFGIQSPESVAETYGGDKQRIAQAAMQGLVDPTAAVLAGMFIDRMRSPQNMQQAQNPPTVAQQVLGVTPPQKPMGPPQGLEALGGMPEEASFAAGGLVAFADGGMAPYYDIVQQLESGGDPNARSPAGAYGLMQLMPGTMTDPGFGVSPVKNNSPEENQRVGREYLDAMHKRYGNPEHALAAYNWGPGNVDKWRARGANPEELPAETRRYIKNATGRSGRIKDVAVKIDTKPIELGETPKRIFASIQGLTPEMREQMGITTDALDAVSAHYQDMLSPETEKKNKTNDKWEFLADLGFRLASTKSPYFMQALGAAATEALPGAKETRRERQKEKREAIRGLAEVEGIKNRQAMEVTEYTTNLLLKAYGIDQASDEVELRERLAKMEVDLGYAKIKADKEMNTQDNATMYSLYSQGFKGPKASGGNKGLTVNQKSAQIAKMDEDIEAGYTNLDAAIQLADKDRTPERVAEVERLSQEVDALRVKRNYLMDSHPDLQMTHKRFDRRHFGEAATTPQAQEVQARGNTGKITKDDPLGWRQ